MGRSTSEVPNAWLLSNFGLREDQPKEATSVVHLSHAHSNKMRPPAKATRRKQVGKSTPNERMQTKILLTRLESHPSSFRTTSEELIAKEEKEIMRGRNCIE
jgi:hypothetical protein